MRTEKLEHITKSLLTGLRDHIWTIVSLMEEIKPTETKNKEKWIELMNRCQLTNNSETLTNESNCGIIQCNIHQIKTKKKEEIKNNKERNQTDINNIEFDLVNDGMTTTEHEDWMNKSKTESDLNEEDISSPPFGFCITDLKLLPKPNQTTELKDLPMNKECRLMSSTINPHIPIEKQYNFEDV